MVCPYNFSRLHRGGWVLCVSLYMMALVCAIMGYDTETERLAMIMLCLKVYCGMLVVIESLAWWMRKCWLDGAFQSFTIDVLMASRHEEDARDIMYNVAVWPVVKTQNKIHQWHLEAVGVIMKVYCVGPILALIAVIFA